MAPTRREMSQMPSKNVNPDPWQDDDGWTVESEASGIKVTFDNVGDKFTGVKTGKRWVEMPGTDDGGFTVYTFAAMGMTAHGVENGELCDIQETFKLKALDDVADGRLVRITRLTDIPMGGKRQPMHNFRIESREFVG